MQALHQANALADTLQAVPNGIVNGLGYEQASVNLVLPDGDLVVAACAGSTAVESEIGGRVGSRAAWEQLLVAGEAWGDLRFVSHAEADTLRAVPHWSIEGPAPLYEGEWHPADRLFAPMYISGVKGGSSAELLGVICVDRPRNNRLPDLEQRKLLQSYAFHAATAIRSSRLRANMQRALVRLEREQQALRASEESFRQAFEYAPGGMAIAEMGGDQHGRLLRTNDALCRLLGLSASAIRRHSFSDLVHPEDIGTLLRTSAEGGRAELRLARRDNSYVWVSLRNSVVADTTDGPRFLLTHVEDIEERKRNELQLAHRASHDSLTGLPNNDELRARLSARLCERPNAISVRETAVQILDKAFGGYEGGNGGGYDEPGYGGFNGTSGAGTGGGYGGAVEDYEPGYEPYDSYGDPAERAYQGDGFDLSSAPAPLDHHVHIVAPGPDPDDGSKGLAVLFCDLDGFKSINDRFGHRAGDAVLVESARRLGQGVRDGDTVARLRGDQFVILADQRNQAEAEDLTQRLRKDIINPIRIDGRAMRVGINIDISWAQCGRTADETLHAADLQMNDIKRSRHTNRRTT
ncbi:diguanylate cyclase domain-containing protein [Streptomyces niveus]|uniref:diguanylate cyclase domain-containing protein n=1 Tax=Streptomyces niveus TaxID=193462 RepID=UPI003643CC04